LPNTFHAANNNQADRLPVEIAIVRGTCTPVAAAVNNCVVTIVAMRPIVSPSAPLLTSPSLCREGIGGAHASAVAPPDHPGGRRDRRQTWLASQEQTIADPITWFWQAAIALVLEA
jgi:hypothetical protein